MLYYFAYQRLWHPLQHDARSLLPALHREPQKLKYKMRLLGHFTVSTGEEGQYNEQIVQRRHERLPQHERFFPIVCALRLRALRAEYRNVFARLAQS